MTTITYTISQKMDCDVIVPLLYIYQTARDTRASMSETAFKRRHRKHKHEIRGRVVDYGAS